MKELSIEDKAKRYDEAIKRVENIKTGKCETTFMFTEGLFDYIFPELAESEDKKIIKAIYNCVKWFGFDSCFFKDVSQEECLAWLEKQGKPIDINPSEFDLHLNRLLKQFETLPKEELASSLSFYLNVVQNNGTYKQGEQKPAEWSEEDEAIYYGVIETEQYMLDVVNGIKKFNVGNISIKEECTRELNWLKSLKDRVQPKQEWSEEEIEICAREAEDNNCIILARHIRQLKSLRPKSTWKPTEQQMKVLNEVINFAADHGTMRWNDYIYNVLKGLREQLNKL